MPGVSNLRLIVSEDTLIRESLMVKLAYLLS